MGTTVSTGSTNYTVPAYGDAGWAQGAGNLSSYLVALAANKLDIAGHKMCFGLIVDTPIVDYLFGHTTIQQITATTSIITPPNTSGETAWTGPVT